MRRFTIDVETEGNGEIVNLNPMINKSLGTGTADGLVNLFIAGSTAAITTLEYEPGLVKYDMPRMFQRLFPDDMPYQHEATWNDDNGHSHIRAAVFGPSISVPYAGGKLLTGEWQHVVLIDFDTRPRRRRVVCTCME